MPERERLAALRVAPSPKPEPVIEPTPAPVAPTKTPVSILRAEVTRGTDGYITVMQVTPDMDAPWTLTLKRDHQNKLYGLTLTRQEPDEAWMGTIHRNEQGQVEGLTLIAGRPGLLHLTEDRN